MTLRRMGKESYLAIFVLLTCSALLSACYNTTALPADPLDLSYKIIEIDSQFQAPIVKPIKQPRAFSREEPKTPYDYVIGPGDVLLINLYVIDASGGAGLVRIFPQAPALPSENQFLVDTSGMVAIPYAGKVRVGGVPFKQAREKIHRVMRKFFHNPQLEMSVSEFANGRVLLSGEFKSPKEVKLSQKPLTIMEAIEQAEGVLPNAALRLATLKGPKGRVESIDLYALLYEGDDSQNRVLSHGDTLHIPRGHGNKMFVVGEAVEPKAVVMERVNVTLTEALDEVKGLDPKTANPEAVYVLREQLKGGEETEVSVYRMDATDPRSYIYGDKFIMQPRDVLFIGSRDITDWGRFVEQLLPGSVAALVQPSPYILR